MDLWPEEDTKEEISVPMSVLVARPPIEDTWTSPVWKGGDLTVFEREARTMEICLECEEETKVCKCGGVE